MPASAVITGDIVNSTQLDEDSEKRLLQRLNDILKPHKFEFYRGDSFQVYLQDSRQALEIALKCRTAAIGLIQEAAEVVSDVRISIGIGEVASPVLALGSAKGTAFVLSGRALDDLEKTEGRLVIVTENPMANLALGILTDYINSIYRQLTAKQAEVLLELFNGETQQQVAEKLNRSKSTISQHVTAGRWEEIEKIIKQYINIVELLP